MQTQSSPQVPIFTETTAPGVFRFDGWRTLEPSESEPRQMRFRFLLDRGVVQLARM
jgi:hypothetical protein